MLSLALNTLALAAVSNALPSEHKRGHSHHHHRRDVVYDTSNVDWAAIDWASVFGQKPAATTTPASAAETPATTAAEAAVPATTEAQAAAVATTAASAASASSPAASSSSSVSGDKRGLAWDMGNDPSLASIFEGSPLTWTYNWNMQPSFSSSMQYVYQIRDTAALGDLSSMPAGSTAFGFNEPDQSGLSAAEAASLYLSQVTPLRESGAIGSLGTPPITNGGSGLPWLVEFMDACSACKIDFVAVHWYGPDMDLLESQMETIHAAVPDLSVWITEVGCTDWNVATNPSAADIATFLSAASAWFEATSWIARWAWFAAMPITDTSLGVANELLLGATAGSSISSLGSQYIA